MAKSIEHDTDDNQRPEAKYAVPALDKALDVIELLARVDQPMNQADIARALDRNPSELFRTFSALEARRYIRRTDGGRFRLTLKLFELSRTHSPYDDMLRVALPIMRAMSDEISESCHLSMLRHGKVLILAQIDSPSPIRLAIESGSQHSPLTTTSGRLLLSCMEPAERNDFLEHFTDFSDQPIDTRDTFITRLHSIRERGYEITNGERFVGGLDVGALVGTPSSTVKAALVVSALRRADGPDAHRIALSVSAAASRIARDSGIVLEQPLEQSPR